MVSHSSENSKWAVAPFNESVWPSYYWLAIACARKYIRERKINRKKKSILWAIAAVKLLSDSFSFLLLSLHKRCLFQSLPLQAGLPSLRDLDIQSREEQNVNPRQIELHETWSFQRGQRSVQILQKEMSQQRSVPNTETSDMPRNKVLMGGPEKRVHQSEQERHS